MAEPGSELVHRVLRSGSGGFVPVSADEHSQLAGETQYLLGAHRFRELNPTLLEQAALIAVHQQLGASFQNYIQAWEHGEGIRRHLADMMRRYGAPPAAANDAGCYGPAAPPLSCPPAWNVSPDIQPPHRSCSPSPYAAAPSPMHTSHSGQGFPLQAPGYGMAQSPTGQHSLQARLLRNASSGSEWSTYRVPSPALQHPSSSPTQGPTQCCPYPQGCPHGSSYSSAACCYAHPPSPSTPTGSANMIFSATPGLSMQPHEHHYAMAYGQYQPLMADTQHGAARYTPYPAAKPCSRFAPIHANHASYSQPGMYSPGAAPAPAASYPPAQEQQHTSYGKAPRGGKGMRSAEARPAPPPPQAPVIEGVPVVNEMLDMWQHYACLEEFTFGARLLAGMLPLLQHDVKLECARIERRRQLAAAAAAQPRAAQPAAAVAPAMSPRAEEPVVVAPVTFAHASVRAASPPAFAMQPAPAAGCTYTRSCQAAAAAQGAAPVAAKQEAVCGYEAGFDAAELLLSACGITPSSPSFEEDYMGSSTPYAPAAATKAAGSGDWSATSDGGEFDVCDADAFCTVRVRLDF